MDTKKLYTMTQKGIVSILILTILWGCGTQHIPSADDIHEGMVLIPAGAFEMGSHTGKNNERPVHTVYLDAFYMDIYEVTNAQYKAFIDANPEWEKAARGGHIDKAYPSGDTLDASLANYARHLNAPIAVGQYPPNGYGLYDMAGNISEWCLDEYDSNFYATSRRENPFSKGKRQTTISNFKKVQEKERVLRGGCWSDKGLFLRVAYRDWGPQSYSSVFRGFRCVKDKE